MSRPDYGSRTVEDAAAFHAAHYMPDDFPPACEPPPKDDESGDDHDDFYPARCCTSMTCPCGGWLR